MRSQIIKQYEIEITEEAGVISKTFDLDKDIIKVHGLLLQSDRDDLLYYRGACKIELNRDELFPDRYAAKNLMSGFNVPVNERFYDLGGLEPGNRVLKVDFTDRATTAINFDHYTLFICLLCEINETL